MNETLKDKFSRCRFAFPDFLSDKNGIKYVCHQQNDKEINTEECEHCLIFKSKFIEYPITVNGISYNDFKFNTETRTGKFVKIRPCAEEYKNKTYLGIYLGNIPTSPYVSYNEDEKNLNVGVMSNPGIFVPELNKIIFGYESWWGVINSKDDLKDITDEDINNVWYVQALKNIYNNTEGNDKT